MKIFKTPEINFSGVFFIWNNWVFMFFNRKHAVLCHKTDLFNTKTSPKALFLQALYHRPKYQIEIITNFFSSY